ncbi:MAG: hypothetical protein AAGJ50_08235, partial [Pseudomonadota bacterium]
LDMVNIRLLGIPVDIRAYVGILATLGVGGYRDESLGLNGLDYGDDHFTCFQFDYDWRRDNVENAARLDAFIQEKRAYIQAEYKKRYGLENADVKFDIVAHSMGGLITRYYMRYGATPLPANGSLPPLTWEGAENLERVILVGTPNAGAGEAFEQLMRGYDPGRPVLPHYPAPILGTFPSVYELLPRTRHGLIQFEDGTPVDIFNGEIWTENNWGLAADTEEVTDFLRIALPEAPDDTSRRRHAEAFQTAALKQAQTFQAALDIPSAPPKGTNIYLVAGDSEETPFTIEVSRETGAVRFKDFTQGDGRVPRSSALMDERVGSTWKPELVSPVTWSSVTFLPSSHIGLTSDPVFTNNVLYMLLEDPR